jgi:hypothetical protein
VPNRGNDQAGASTDAWITLPSPDDIARAAATIERLDSAQYAARGRPLSWDIAPLHLAEVTALARAERPELWHDRSARLLTALHQPGQAVAMAMLGDGTRQRVYFGGRRVVGAAASSTADFLQRLTQSLQAEFVGLSFSNRETRPISAPAHAELRQFVSLASSFAAITGAPAVYETRQGREPWSVDRLARIVGSARFALLAVAEALSPQDTAARMLDLQDLLALIQPAVRRSVQRGSQTSESASLTMTQQTLDSLKEADPEIAQAWTILRRYGTMVPGVGSMVFALQNFAGGTLSQQGQRSGGQSNGESGEIYNARAEACVRLLQQQVERLRIGQATGAWRAVTYVAAENDATLELVVSGLRALLSGEGAVDEPVRVHAIPPSVLRGAMLQGQVIYVPAETIGAEQRDTDEPIATTLTSRELAVLVQPPAGDILGLPSTRVPTFGRAVPAQTGPSVDLGQLEDAAGQPLGTVSLSARALNRHALVVGKTGFGKSNTCLQLLLEAWCKLKTPFLVLEPAKAEYRRLAQVEELRGKLRVYGIGSDSPLPLRLNPLSPVPGFPLGRHVDLLKGVFNASFPMGAGMPYVLEDALTDLYRDRGWNLTSSRNEQLGPGASDDEIAALTPDLADLHAQIEVVLVRKGYSSQIHSDLGAALRSRVGSLMQGNKGLTLNARRSIAPAELFDAPTVIELESLADDEEKAFVMALLLVLLYEYAEVRYRDRPPEARAELRHLTLVEEAHRLLRATHGSGPSEHVGDPRGKAVTMFTDMLAELRAYGEGFIIADQVPVDLAPQILKNTDIKIIHRLTASDDRYVLAQSIDLTEDQARHLTNLKPGVAVVHSEDVAEAITVRVFPVTQGRVRDLPRYQLRHYLEGMSVADRRYLLQHGGCRHCPRPGVFAVEMDIASGPLRESQLETVLNGLFSRTQQRAWDAWRAWRHPLAASYAPAASSDDGIDGFAYCAATDAAHRWIAKQYRLLTSGADRRPGGSAAARPLPTMSAGSARTQPATTTELTAAQRLGRERLVSVMADWIALWSAPDLTEPPAAAAFEACQQAILDELGRGMVRTGRHCPVCGGRCVLLLEVLPHLPAVRKAVASPLGTTLSPSARLETIRQAVGKVLPGWPTGQEARPEQDHILHCILDTVQFPETHETPIDEMLPLLRPG